MTWNLKESDWILYLFIGAVTSTSTAFFWALCSRDKWFYCIISHFIIVNPKFKSHLLQRFKTLIFQVEFGLVYQYHARQPSNLNSFINDIIFTLKWQAYRALTCESSKVSAPLRFQYRLNLLLKFTIIFFCFFHHDQVIYCILKCKFSKIKQEMFTGIIETLGTIQGNTKRKDNLHITVDSTITADSNWPKCRSQWNLLNRGLTSGHLIYGGRNN
jgi:hypothetical protein